MWADDGTVYEFKPGDLVYFRMISRYDRVVVMLGEITDEEAAAGYYPVRALASHHTLSDPYDYRTMMLPEASLYPTREQ